MSLYKEYIMNEEGFNRLSNGTIIRTVITRELGVYLDKSVIDKPLMFVAKKGNYNDWAVYWLELSTAPYNVSPMDSIVDAWITVTTNGHKPFTEAVIRNILPCTDEVYKKYRH